MDGCFIAKDGERAYADGSRPDQDQSGTGALSRAPSQGSRLFFLSEPSPQSIETPNWVHDHEGVNLWLRSIPVQDRPAFLGRLAANIETIQHTQTRHLEPGCEDTVLSYAILIEYAEHMGVSPMEVCWTFESDTAEPVDALLGARVDRMLADAARKKSEPRRRGEDAGAPSRLNRGLSSHWKATSSRRARDRRDEEHTMPGWSATRGVAFHASEPGRAG
jgi:hypothetical protein